MIWPVDPPKKRAPRRPMWLAAVIAVPDVTMPDNAVRMYAGALAGDNVAHEIKQTFDDNHPQPPEEVPKTTE